MSWPQAIAVYAVALGVVSWGSSWRDVAEALGFIAAAIALVALLLPIARLIVSRLPPYPFASSNLFVGHVKEFLSHALLAEPIEVKAKGQTGA